MLRDYQVGAIDQLREALRQGAKRPVIQAPTGAGKTILAAEIIRMAREKGKRVIFTVPAISLIDQTVERFRGVGIHDIGVMQGAHEMTDRHQPVQVCSVQTLARRTIPMVDLVIVDEAHVMFKIYDKWMQNPAWERIPFVGLTATPWSKGMGAEGRWDKLIVCTTTQDLINRGHLSDFKTFAPSHPDLGGVKTLAGDYDLRGLGDAMDKRPLVADIVSTWLEKGENRPTICFAVNRVHAKHIQTLFQEAGVVAEYMDAYTDRHERNEIVERFQTGQTKIICNVGVLTTGFDADVRCIILARPTKSEILFVQMIGRGLRTAPGKDHCIARGSKILTNKGEVNIEDVTLDHLVWDGVSFVRHGGAVCRGVQPVITYAGITATTDHRVMTDDGWKEIAEASRRRLRVAVTGFGGKPIRFSDDHKSGNIWVSPTFASACEVLQVLAKSHGALSQHQEAPGYASLPKLQRTKTRKGAEMALSKMSIAAGQMSKSTFDIVRKIWRTWNPVQIQLSQRGCKLGLEQLGGGRSFNAIGQDRQQRPLRAGKSSLDGCCGEHEQHSQKQRRETKIYGVQEDISSSQVCGLDSKKAHSYGVNGSANSGSVDATITQAQGEVWDILNAGPLQRFTANGRLVHNCLILDHSDTTLRLGFVTDISKPDLDDGQKKVSSAKTPPLPKECPKCSFLRPPKMRVCAACGFVPEAKSQVDVEEGDLHELTRDKKQKVQDWPAHKKSMFYGELLLHAFMRGYKTGWAYWAYKDRFGVAPSGSFGKRMATMIGPETEAWIRHYNIKKAKRREKTGRVA
jgi:hypothetical protein